VTISASRRSHTDGNPYLAISEKPAWTLLRKLDAMNPRLATAILRHACGFEAAPGAQAVMAWIAGNGKSLLPLLEKPAATYPADLVPYGDPTHPMTVKSAGKQPDEAQATWEKYCREHGIDLGIGPWGEARTVYAGEMFASKLIDDVRRTRHLGLDLFMAAGTKVYTPLAATVVSVEIEKAPLGYGGLIALRHEPEGCPAFVTLWGHLAHEALDKLKSGDRLDAGALVGKMGAPNENGGWAPHLHLQISTDTSLSATEILGVGEERYLDVWAELFPDARTFAGIAPEFYEQKGRSHEEIVKRRRELLLPNLSISYDKPIKFVRGEGVWLIDDRGRAYLDCFNNVCHIGHAHPAVVEAMARQAATLNTNTRYLHDNIVAYAERLTVTLPRDLTGCRLRQQRLGGQQPRPAFDARSCRRRKRHRPRLGLSRHDSGTDRHQPLQIPAQGRQRAEGACPCRAGSRQLSRAGRLAGRRARQSLCRECCRADRGDAGQGRSAGILHG